MSTIIRVENLSKIYQLGQISSRTLSSDLARWWAKFRKLPDPLSRVGLLDHNFRHKKWINALNEVSFTVKEGEVLGIIGNNGAGKSTLLKILSRVTTPSNGKIKVKGRIASLLEVGTGFHPELTGKENIYLNGAILGMSKQEISRKFESIVDFSGIEEFIDTPVKRYSSGMYVRLAFSVAAFLEPEILIVDEVLAVGDATFQKKCLGKMSEVAQNGRTVLFVSHNIPAVVRLCNRAILLKSGSIAMDGPTQEVTNYYLRSDTQVTAEQQWARLEDSPGDDIVRLRKVRICSNDQTVDRIKINNSVDIEITYDVLKSSYLLHPNIHVYNDEGIYLFVSIDSDPYWKENPRIVGRYCSTVSIPSNFLAEGVIRVGVAVTTFEPWKIHFYERDVVALQIIDILEQNTARIGFEGTLPGVIRPLLNWNTKVEHY